MRIPTIHMNGTGKNMLLEGYKEAYLAIGKAEKSLNEIEFNARDYYTQGDTAWNEAVKEMKDRYAALGQIKKDLLEIAMAIKEA